MSLLNLRFAPLTAPAWIWKRSRRSTWLRCRLLTWSKVYTAAHLSAVAALTRSLGVALAIGHGSFNNEPDGEPGSTATLSHDCGCRGSRHANGWRGQGQR